MIELQTKLITKQGYEKLCDELEDLKVNKRKQIAVKLKEAREQGDLSENAEYDAARDEQRSIELKIEELQQLIKSSEITDGDLIDKNIVHIGCKVLVKDLTNKEQLELQIVGPLEVNSLIYRISNESPLGAALIDHKVGEIVTYKCQEGCIDLKIIKILETI